jgi:hypothetical protein
MAVFIPIISEFNSKGIDKAVKEFKSLEGAGQKAQFAIKKAAVPAALALAGLGAALFDATKGAIEDEAAQALLATTLKKTTGATDAQIKANEDWISTQGKLLGVTDDELRPVIGRLAKATGSMTKAQELATAAMDIAASTGKPLATVTASLEKAYGGNMTALAKLSPELRQMIKDGASFDDVMAAMAKTTGGAATTAANTAQGQFKRLGVALSETKESIGAALLPAIEAVLPFLQKMGQWAQDHTTTFVIIAGVIAGIAAAVVIANAAITAWGVATKVLTGIQIVFNAVMAMNPITLIVIAIAALIAGLVLAYKHFDSFRAIVDTVGRAIKTGFLVYFTVIKTEAEILFFVFKTLFNGIATLWNNSVGKLSFKAPSWVPGIGGKGFEVPNIPMLAAGGIVTSPTLAMIGERGPEAVIPLTGPNAGGGMGNNVTIHVNGGDPNQVVDALRRYMRVNGSVPITVS